jgi:hypothetical protein
LTAAAQSNIEDRENRDPFATLSEKSGKDIDDPFRMKSISPDEDELESSFETVIHYNSKPSENWSQSTPAAATGRGRKSSTRRKSTKPKTATTTGMYPELSLYPDISIGKGDLPTTSTESFSRIADGILEEMNSRLTCIFTLSTN